MNLKEKLQQLAQQREQMWIALHETNGAMKILEEQILEAAPELNQPLDTEASSQESKTASSKSKAYPTLLKFLSALCIKKFVR